MATENVNSNTRTIIILEDASDDELTAIWTKDPVLKFLLRSIPDSFVYIKRITNCPAANDGSHELYEIVSQIISHGSTEKRSDLSTLRFPKELQQVMNCTSHGNEQLLGSMIFSRTKRLMKLAELNNKLLLQQRGSSLNIHSNRNQVMKSQRSSSLKCFQTKFDDNGKENISRMSRSNSVSHDRKPFTDAIVSAFDPLCDMTNTAKETNHTVQGTSTPVSVKLKASFDARRLRNSTVQKDASNPDLIWFSPAKAEESKNQPDKIDN